MVEEGAEQEVEEVGIGRAVSIMAAFDDHDAKMALCDGLSGDLRLEKAYVQQMVDCFRLWQDRQRKYGKGNIAEFGATGCLVRLHDKMARLRRVYMEGAGDTPDESVEDSWRDAVNYALMGLMCHKGQW